MIFSRHAARSGLPPSENRLSARFREDEGGTGNHAGDPGSRAEDLFARFFEGGSASFRECYTQITGDSRVTGKLADMNRDRMCLMLGRFAETVDTTGFSNALGAALNRALELEYAKQAENTRVWRRVAKVVRLNDFRTHRAVRMGGYGALPAVAQGAPYAALASPGDEAAPYAATKRGGTEDVTLEAVKNDDVSLLREIPKRIATAAARTLGSFVLDFLRTNPAIYDGVALFHASHGNLGSSALSAVSLTAGFNAIRKQTEYGSGERLDLRAKRLLVPFELQETGHNLLVRDTNNDLLWIQRQGIEVVPVWDWTDGNDWVLAADPATRAGIEVGFLDGQENPEFFIQDAPSAGSLFSNDKITLKVRHIYGGTVTDFRPFYKAVVS